jgi:choline monooxygenase
VEDIALCEAVQLGLQEPAYGVGRYAPGPEAPMFHFHSQLYEQLKDVAAEPARR